MRGLLLAGLVWAAARPALAAGDAAADAALAKAANEHPDMGAVLRGQTWDAATVQRLAGWLSGRGEATPADLALLRDELSRPVALSVAGAVSLGSYQGGFLYYLVRALDERRHLAASLRERAAGANADGGIDDGSPLTAVTGSSSGSINALIAAMASCQTPVRNPRASLFWSVWIPVGAEALTSDRQVTADGLLSTEPIDAGAKAVRDAWNDRSRWSPQPCLVDVGLSVTRRRARLLQPLDGVDLTLPLQTEKLLFTVAHEGRGAPALAPFGPPPGDARAPFFDKLLRKIARYDIDGITDVLRASSAFSFAFPPRWLNLVAADQRAALGTGHDPQWFTDGGVFDNRPIGLAVDMRRWRAAREHRAPESVHTRFIIQDPDGIVARQVQRQVVEQPVPAPPRGPFVDTWLPFLEDFVGSAFALELLDALEREPMLFEGLEAPTRRVPVAGAYLGEFLAFAEKDFRVFDFFSGMVDAWQHLADTSLAFQVIQALNRGPTFDGAPEFACLLGRRVGGAGGPEPDACRQVGVDPPDDLLRANLVALARASTVTKSWRDAQANVVASTIPGEQATFLGALGQEPHPYVYRELRYRSSPATAATVDLAIRDTLQALLERTTFNQTDGAGRLLVGGVGKALLNYAYVYRAPTVFAGVGLVSDRGLELTAAGRLPFDRLPAPLDLRVDLAVRVFGIHATQDYLGPPGQRTLAMTYLAAAHLTNELQLQRWIGREAQSTVQLHVGAGWAVESMQTWNGPVLWRHGPEALVGASLFQRFTLDFTYERWLDNCSYNNRCANIDPSVRDQVSPIVDTSWGLRFSVGYRYFLN